MKKFALILSAVLAAISCNQQRLVDIAMKNISTPERVAKTEPVEKEIFTLYRKTENVFHIARAISTNPENFDLLLYEVNTSRPEAAEQKFVSVEHLTQPQLTSRKNALQVGYNWDPFKHSDVLFVQIQPKDFKNEIEVLDKSHEIEAQLSRVLESRKLGEWIASDVGPGGGNSLYKVIDIDKSLEILVTVLNENKLDKSVLIGRRVFVTEDDWFYEVIYPAEFSGVFNTM